MSAGCLSRNGNRQQNARRACSKENLRPTTTPPSGIRTKRDSRAPSRPRAAQRATLSLQQWGRRPSPSKTQHPLGASSPPSGRASSGRRLPRSATWPGAVTWKGAWGSSGGPSPSSSRKTSRFVFAHFRIVLLPQGALLQ